MSESGKTGCLVAILIFLFIGAISTAAKQCGDKKPQYGPVAQSSQGNPQLAEKSQEPVRVYTSAERLAEAKKALEAKTKNYPYGNLPEAEHHLNNIKPEDKEYQEAKKLLAEIEKKKAILQKARDRELEKFNTEARKLYADRLEREYLSKGMDIEVTVSGERNTTIKLKYVLMSRPLVYKLTNETEYLQNMKKLGFKKVILTDGYYHTWTFDLTKFP